MQPLCLDPSVESALEISRTVLEQQYGPRLLRLVLFGSRARGESHAESDVDVLVVLQGPVDYAEEIERLLDLEMDLMDRFHLLVSFIPVSQTQYEDVNHPLMQNVHAEGITL